jgi:hypothetical protein
MRRFPDMSVWTSIGIAVIALALIWVAADWIFRRQ